MSKYVSTRTPERALLEKMRVLRDFYIVDDDNYDEVYKELRARACVHPDNDFDRALDRAAATLIQGKLERTV